MNNLKLLLLFTPLLFPLSTEAAGPVAPNAGSILQQVQPPPSQAPSSNGTGLTIEQEGVGKLPPSSPFEVKTLQISGNALFGTEILHKLVADAEGQTITLSRLDELIARITNFYHDHGYPLARAYIPAQSIHAGVVQIAIIEARYGNVKIDNHSNVKDSLLNLTIAPLKEGQPIEQMGIDRALLLLSDIPGLEVNATLKPGDTVGSSDLFLETTPGAVFAGNLALDNYGNRSTGRERASSALTFYNPLHYGDYLSLNVLTSGNELNYGRIAYDSILNGQGAHLGGSYSSLHYILGDTFSSLDGHGTAQVESLWMKQPLVRSKDANLYGQIQLDHMLLRDETITTQSDRHLNNWTASLSGDSRDGYLSLEANNTWNASWTAGHVGFDNPATQSSEAQGKFTKLNVNLARLQRLSQKNALYLNFVAQGANVNLDASQKFSIGGAETVRAYDMNAVSGDTGYILTTELRRDVGFAWQSQIQAVAFIDTAHTMINKYMLTGANSATLTGAGIGFNWTGSKLWFAKTYVATPIGSTPALVGPSSSVRAWIEIAKEF